MHSSPSPRHPAAVVAAPPAGTASPRTAARVALIVAALGALAALALGLGLSLGSVPVDFATVVRALVGADDSPGAAIVRDLRLPRALAAFAVGGLLAVAGALLQVLLRNPLADPYILGVSGGAATGALGAMFVGAAALVTPAAVAGAVAATAAVFALARSGAERAPWNATRLLLTGVVVAAGCGAQVKGMLFWLIGDLSSVAAPGPALAALAVCVAIAIAFARDLTLLARGEDVAAALGVHVARTTLVAHGCAALATAVAVTTAGSVGFVGLVVPQALRLVLGNDQRLVLPASALAGGAFLTLADTLARTLVAPAQLPVGVITALIGVPVFLWLLARREPSR